LGLWPANPVPNAWGTPQPAARPAASPYAQPAAQPAPAPGAPRGVYQQYRPQARPTPAAQPGESDVARVKVHKDSVAIALKGGLAARLGEEAKFHTGGWNGGAEFLYQASPDLDAAFFIQYS
jgi:hypothetical protein